MYVYITPTGVGASIGTGNHSDVHHVRRHDRSDLSDRWLLVIITAVAVAILLEFAFLCHPTAEALWAVYITLKQRQTTCKILKPQNIQPTQEHTSKNNYRNDMLSTKPRNRSRIGEAHHKLLNAWEKRHVLTWC